VTVSLRVDNVAQQVRISVSDTGQGISSEDQQHIFDRFYRAESARSRGAGAGGTGLGLSICRSVVQNHGGEIACRSECDRGATFDVVLPMTAAIGAADCQAI
jgi:signal transduction histidine kinase